MRQGESVTFGTSGLDRAAALRADAARLGEMLASGPVVLPVWRGKPCLDAQTRAAFWVSADHKVLTHADEAPVFLGLDNGTPRFAQDISGWDPEALPDTLGAFHDPSEQRHPALGDGAVFAELRANMTRLTRRDAELVATARAILGWHESHGFCANCGTKSVISNAGWQRDCPACGRHHFPRTDPVVIMLITHGNSVLMGRSPGWPEGMYSLLAGFVEPGETIEAAVRRETFEEAGVTVGEVRYLSSQPWPFPSSLMFGCEGHATSAEIRIDPNEIEDALWVSREDMMQAFAGAHPLIKPARKGAIARFLIENWLADRLD
ncbi:NAD(+) diphosphatase [Alphaproteobacteria bacterium GH1-50]|uniref:NAD(+) diphosphatase n=1 Tax=Kangsaoukella pontilimi TaxID=2691042 RepID=A0A7C9IH92_9RHOB|nr:NAD(+) diphosphatase [Kangsaoukella pontilimi]MXQ08467.1 NAD(+) diphosphatase [Kangsaoukella pontilimi]